MDFPGKKGCRFLNISIMYHCAKKKRSQAEGLTNTQTDTDTDTDRHKDRLIEKDDFIRRTGVQLFRETMESAYKASQEKNPKAFSG